MLVSVPMFPAVFWILCFHYFPACNQYLSQTEQLFPKYYTSKLPNAVISQSFKHSLNPLNLLLALIFFLFQLQAFLFSISPHSLSPAINGTINGILRFLHPRHIYLPDSDLLSRKLLCLRRLNCWKKKEFSSWIHILS